MLEVKETASFTEAHHRGSSSRTAVWGWTLHFDKGVRCDSQDAVRISDDPSSPVVHYTRQPSRPPTPSHQCRDFVCELEAVVCKHETAESSGRQSVTSLDW